MVCKKKKKEWTLSKSAPALIMKAPSIQTKRYNSMHSGLNHMNESGRTYQAPKTICTRTFWVYRALRAARADLATALLWKVTAARRPNEALSLKQQQEDSSNLCLMLEMSKDGGDSNTNSPQSHMIPIVQQQKCDCGTLNCGWLFSVTKQPHMTVNKPSCLWFH